VRRPRVKRAHDPIRFPGGRIRIGSVQYSVGAEIRDSSGHVWRALQLMDGSRGPQDIIREMQAGPGGLDAASARAIVEQLCDSGYIEDAAADTATGFSHRELERYSRNENYFGWVDTTPRDEKFGLQARLRDARVSVIGLGGSGSTVATSLVCAGVGHIRCVDFDTVELSNLNRQVLYTEDDLGASKVERAVARLSRMNTEITVEGLEQRIDSVKGAAAAIDEVDFTVLCADMPHPDVQLWTNDAAAASSKPWSVCFYAGPTLMTGIFVPGQTPCYRCLLASGPSPLRNDQGATGEALYGATDVNGVIAPTAGLAGQFGALEVIYFLTGLRPQTVGRLFHQNLMIYDHSYYVEPRARPDCCQCAGLVSSVTVEPAAPAVTDRAGTAAQPGSATATSAVTRTAG
jgi:molybdopterin-synthase adenylyltransferase